MPPERIVAVHDELDIPFGTLRVKLGGGDNGHNGLRSMRPRSAPATSTASASASAGRPGRQDVGRLRAVQLLRRPSARSCPIQVDEAADAVETLVTDGLEQTQQSFNC